MQVMQVMWVVLVIRFMWVMRDHADHAWMSHMTRSIVLSKIQVMLITYLCESNRSCTAYRSCNLWRSCRSCSPCSSYRSHMSPMMQAVQNFTVLYCFIQKSIQNMPYRYQVCSKWSYYPQRNHFSLYRFCCV